MTRTENDLSFFLPDENMQVTRHSYTMKYLLGLALGKWIVSHRCKSITRLNSNFVYVKSKLKSFLCLITTLRKYLVNRVEFKANGCVRAILVSRFPRLFTPNEIRWGSGNEILFSEHFTITSGFISFLEKNCARFLRI